MRVAKVQAVGLIQVKSLTNDHLDADEFLKSGWTQDCIDGVVIEMLVESISDTWTAQQVWGMCDINGERRQVRKVLTKKGSKEHKISIVYDYVSK
jgi:hypothetical protein